ncbi:MAG: DUF393 domain-containing protein [Akkermansiaceae bacterium]|nr:DUF393 domain-containing protein [Akkermansiaceae bacterium]
MASRQPSEPDRHILFLDGECLFCQTSARVLYRWDRSKKIYFSTLQGETAGRLPDDWKKLTDDHGRPAGTAVLIENANQPDERQWRSADAILRSLKLTGSILAVFWVFSYVPGAIKNGLYRLLARNRHRLTWGKRSCPLPEQDFKKRFLP